MADDFATQATALLSGKPIILVGDAWGAEPIYRAEIAEIDAVFDVHADNETEAAVRLTDAVAGYLAIQASAVHFP